AGDLRARAEAGVSQTTSLEFHQRRPICFMAPALEDRLLVPVQAEVLEIRAQRIEVFAAAPRGVEILDAEQELSAGGSDLQPTEQRGVGVSEMELAAGAGREPSTHVPLLTLFTAYLPRAAQQVICGPRSEKRMLILHCSDVHITMDYSKVPWLQLGWRRWIAMLELKMGGRGKQYLQAREVLAQIAREA